MTKRIEEGAIRFNTDSNKMEVWIGDKWMQVAVSSPNFDGGDGRGFLAGGTTTPFPTPVNTIDMITIATAGDAVNFSDLTQQVRDGVPPPAETDLVGLEQEPICCVAESRLPKSVASPVVAIVT